MKRDVLFIPLEDLNRHFETNERQDIKIVAPSILTPEIFEMQSKKGKRLKPETPLVGNRWERSYKTTANKLCESSDFAFELPAETKGPFTISFANERAEQEEHYHKSHAELYFSEHRLSGYYRKVGDNGDTSFELNNGGLALFQPNMVHYIELSGLTLILETPALERDRFIEEKMT
jgi:exoribonuclease R